MSKIIVVYGGGFQPFHAGHLSSYSEAKEAFPNADFYVAASNDTKTRPIPFNDKQFLAQQAGVSDPFVQVKMPINPTEILDRYSPKQDIFILVRSERDPIGYTKKDGSPGYYQPFTDISKCEPFGYHGYVFVTKKHEFKLNGQVVYSGTQVRDMYANSDDRGRLNIIKQLYPRSSEQDNIKQMLDKYIGSSEPTVEPDKSAIKQLKAKKLKEQIQRMRPLIREASIEQKYKLLKLIKEAAQLDELNLFGKKVIDKDKLAQKPQPVKAVDDYRTYFSKTAPPKKTGTVYHGLGDYYDKTKKDAFKEEDQVNEISDETIQNYLGKADRQISNRQNRMSQARERLNKNYEIYDVNNPTKIIDKFEANTPELARRYFEKFIKEYNPGDQNFEFEVRRSTGLSEDYLPEK
jgi:cytidyltransferase-like protein